MTHNLFIDEYNYFFYFGNINVNNQYFNRLCLNYFTYIQLLKMNFYYVINERKMDQSNLVYNTCTQKSKKYFVYIPIQPGDFKGIPK